MDLENLRRELVLLLSWREQAQRKLAAIGSREDAEEERAEYAAHLHLAEERLDETRQKAMPEAETQAARLRRLLEEQKGAAERAKAGDAAAGAEQKQLHEAVAEQRQRIANLNKMLRAGDPRELGGFVDLPLDDYAKRARTGAPQRGGAPGSPRAASAPAKARAKRQKQAKAKAPNQWVGPLSKSDRNTIIIALIALVVGVLAVLYVTRWRLEVSFRAEAPQNAAGSVELTCTNNRQVPVFFYAPWPDTQPPEDRDQTYGVQVHGREAGADEFRLLPAAATNWRNQAGPTHLQDATRILPGMTAEVRLDLPGLTTPGVELDALRLVCRRGDGKTINTFTFDWPGRGGG